MVERKEANMVCSICAPTGLKITDDAAQKLRIRASIANIHQK